MISDQKVREGWGGFWGNADRYFALIGRFEGF